MRIQINQAGGIGDLIMQEPAIRGIAEQNPHSILNVVCEDVPELKGKSNILNGLPYIHHFDKQNFKAERIFNLGGYNHYSSYELDWYMKHYNHIDYFCEMIGSNPTDRFPRLPSSPVKKQDDIVIVVCPDSRGDKRKTWDLRKWKILVDKIPYKIIEIGTGWYCKYQGLGEDRTGLPLRESFDEIRKADLFIGNHSGLIIACQVFDIPFVSIWGSIMPFSKILFNHKLAKRFVSIDIECKNCHALHRARLVSHEGCFSKIYGECMDKISVEEVYQNYEEIISTLYERHSNENLHGVPTAS